MLVVLRLSLGCHFLYEGVWKITNADKFSARPFLTQAKGPLAPVFYAMVPDLDGRQRLQIQEVVVEHKDGTKEKGLAVTGHCYKDVWKELLDRSVTYYNLQNEQKADAEKIYNQYVKGLETYLAENFDAIQGYFRSLEEFERERRAGNNGAEFQQARLWDRQQQLRAEVNGWLSRIDQMGEDYQRDLWNKLQPDQRDKGPLTMAAIGPDRLPVPIPYVRGFGDLVDKAVTYGLAAIGLCLFLGLFTRLASLGGAVFLAFVLMTQPPWPTIYPPFPEVVGHAMVVDKNFVEMVALLLLATTAAGRFAGLDYFIHRWFVQPLFSRKKSDDEE